YDVNRMPECVAWVKHGRCTEKDCELRHDIETVECQKYKYGFCRLGNMCRLRHEKHGRQMLPDLVPDWYLRECVPNVFEYVPRMPEDLLRTSIQELKPNRDPSSGEINDTPEECNLLASVSGAWGAPGKQESAWAGQGAASAWSAKPEAAEAGSGWGAPVRGRHGDEAQKSPSGWAALRHQAPANRSSGASWAAPQSKGEGGATGVGTEQIAVTGGDRCPATGSLTVPGLSTGEVVGETLEAGGSRLHIAKVTVIDPIVTAETIGRGRGETEIGDPLIEITENAVGNESDHGEMNSPPYVNILSKGKRDG
ncbi:Cleavage and polyadenylation specificity factor subunit 4, partial [Perkinsus olseni]